MIPGRTLARIDAVLEDWEHGRDASRWHPGLDEDPAGPPEVLFRCPLDDGGTECTCSLSQMRGERTYIP